MKLSCVAFLTLLFIGFSSSAAITGKFARNGTNYICRMIKQSYTREDSVLKVYGKHIKGRVNGREISFGNQDVTIFEASGLGNKFELMPTTVLNLFSKLREMRFASVQLKVLNDKSFRNCVNLKKISFGEDHLELFGADVFKPCSNLDVIEFNGNTFDMIDDEAFNGLSKLRVLTFKFNNLDSFNAELLKPLTGLQELTISGNPIIQFHPDFFVGMSNLRILDVSSNHLDYVSSLFFKNKDKLESVNMTSNHIDAIDENLFENWPNHAVLEMRENFCINNSWKNGIGTDELPLTDVVGTFKKCFDNQADRLKVKELKKFDASGAIENATDIEDFGSDTTEEESEEKSTTGAPIEKAKVEKDVDSDDKSDAESDDNDDDDDDKPRGASEGDDTKIGIFDNDESPKRHDEDTKSESESDENNNKKGSVTTKKTESVVPVPMSSESSADYEGDSKNTTKKGTTGSSSGSNSSSDSSTGTATNKGSVSGAGSASGADSDSGAGSASGESLYDFDFAEGEEVDSLSSEQKHDVTKKDQVKRIKGKGKIDDKKGAVKGKDEVKFSKDEGTFKVDIKHSSAGNNSSVSATSEDDESADDDSSPPVKTKQEFRHSHEEASCRYFFNGMGEYTCVVRNAKQTLKFINTSRHEQGYSNNNITGVIFLNSSLLTIPRVVFETFPNLDQLSVQKCGIKTMDSDMFELCGNLKHLDVTNNHIYRVSGDALKMCPLLETVDLSNNPVEYIESNVFECNPKLNITLGSLRIVRSQAILGSDFV